MINFTFFSNPTLTLACVADARPAAFALEDAAQLSGVHPELLRYYSRAGLIETIPGENDSDLFFTEAALEEVRRIEHYRRQLGVGRRALPLICELRRAGERQNIALTFLRYP